MKSQLLTHQGKHGTHCPERRRSRNEYSVDEIKSSWKKVLLLLAPLLAGPALFLPELSSSAMLFAHPVLL